MNQGIAVSADFTGTIVPLGRHPAPGRDGLHQIDHLRMRGLAKSVSSRLAQAGLEFREQANEVGRFEIELEFADVPITETVDGKRSGICLQSLLEEISRHSRGFVLAPHSADPVESLISFSHARAISWDAISKNASSHQGRSRSVLSSVLNRQPASDRTIIAS
jgi:hypothetical protein